MCSRSVRVKVMLKYTLSGRLWSMRQAPRQSHVSGRSYKQGNSPKDEIKDDAASPVLVRLWSKWSWNIHYWVDSEVYAKYHDERLPADRATSREIPPRTKLKTVLQVQFLCVYGQSDVEIYIIGSPLKYMPNSTMIHWLRTELDAGEFPKMRNGN
jgi:hypothetical protein